MLAIPSHRYVCPEVSEEAKAPEASKVQFGVVLLPTVLLVIPSAYTERNDQRLSFCDRSKRHKHYARPTQGPTVWSAGITEESAVPLVVGATRNVQKATC